MKVAWDDPGDPTASYEYRLWDPVQDWTDWGEIADPEMTLRAREEVTIEWVLTGLPTDVFYTAIEVRASNEKGFSPEAFAAVRPAQVAQRPAQATQIRLDFAHFANGTGITSNLVLVNVASHPIRPALYFYDKEGNLIDPGLVVDVMGDLENHRGRSPECPNGNSLFGRTHDFDPRTRGSGDRIGDGGLRRSHRRGPSL